MRTLSFREIMARHMQIFWAIITISTGGFLCLAPSALSQGVPPLINYQGRLVDGNGLPLATGDYQFGFSIWDAAIGGSLVWGPQIFNGQSGQGFGPLVPVVNGYFNVLLGPLDTNGAPILNVFCDTNRFLEVRNGGSAIAPRQQVLTAPYAVAAQFILGAETKSNLTLHVSTTGSDFNDGLSLATAKRTIQAAINILPSTIRHRVEIQVHPGVYQESVTYQGKATWLGNSDVGTPIIRGTFNNPNDVIIRGTNANYGVYVHQSNVQIWDLTIENFAIGVGVNYRGRLEILRCNLRNNVNYGMELQGDAWASVVSALVIDNEATGAPGIFMRRSFLGLGGTIRNSPVGIYAQWGSTAAGTNFVDFVSVTTPVLADGSSHVGSAAP